MHGTLPKLRIQREDTGPSREAAEEAVRTLIRWAGEDPGREGLVDTPARVVRAYAEWFDGYGQAPPRSSSGPSRRSAGTTTS